MFAICEFRIFVGPLRIELSSQVLQTCAGITKLAQDPLLTREGIAVYRSWEPDHRNPSKETILPKHGNFQVVEPLGIEPSLVLQTSVLTIITRVPLRGCSTFRAAKLLYFPSNHCTLIERETTYRYYISFNLGSNQDLASSAAGQSRTDDT